MKLEEAYRVNFKSKNDDRGDYQIVVSARNSDKALEKVLKQIDAHKEEMKGLTDIYYMLYQDLEYLRERVFEEEEKDKRHYYYAHCPTVESVGFIIK